MAVGAGRTRRGRILLPPARRGWSGAEHRVRWAATATVPASHATEECFASFYRIHRVCEGRS
jgi:hypothetical protein